MNEIDRIVEAALADAKNRPMTKVASISATRSTESASDVASELEKLASSLEVEATSSARETAAFEKKASDHRHDQIMKLAKVAVIIDSLEMLEKNGGLAGIGKAVGTARGWLQSRPAAIKESIKAMKASEREARIITRAKGTGHAGLVTPKTPAVAAEEPGFISKHKVPLAIGAAGLGAGMLLGRKKDKNEKNASLAQRFIKTSGVARAAGKTVRAIGSSFKSVGKSVGAGLKSTPGEFVSGLKGIPSKSEAASAAAKAKDVAQFRAKVTHRVRSERATAAAGKRRETIAMKTYRKSFPGRIEKVIGTPGVDKSTPATKGNWARFLERHRGTVSAVGAGAAGIGSGYVGSKLKE